MRRWGLLVSLLYVLTLVALTWPLLIIAFLPDSLPRKAEDLAGPFLFWPYWVFLGVMGLGQLALLAIPVRLARGELVRRRSLLLPVGASSFAMALLTFGVVMCLYDPAFKVDRLDGGWALLLWPASWIVWAILFWQMGRNAGPRDHVARLCRYLLGGSVLELLIAVPAHVVARNRSECCAGFGTLLGLAAGLSVMLFAFGPGVFFLYADRFRRLRSGAARLAASPLPADQALLPSSGSEAIRRPRPD
jgi:hypothetical protein